MIPSKLPVREQIAHLHRRLGFGATPAEMEAGGRVGAEATALKLIEWEGTPQADAPHPYEFFWRHREKEEASPDAYRQGLWWAYRMLTTARPFEEKLALFWHGHFAVSDAKVDHGPMMLDYLFDVRRHAGGDFPTLLKAMAKSPAMMRYLDLERAIKGHPNENFAREVMELFTMGIGRYSEEDVRALSRCLTGWASVEFWWQLGKTNDERLEVMLKEGLPAFSFAYLESVRDREPKTLLGVTKDLDGDAALDLLARRPETAVFVSGKLWRFFAGGEPEPKTLAALAATFRKTNGSARAVVKTLVREPQFWSAECVRGAVKSPADYVLGIARAQGLGAAVTELRGKDSGPRTQIAERAFAVAGELSYNMEKQGLHLLYPPDVSGWKPGQAWIGPAAMAERMKYRGTLIWDDKGPSIGTKGAMAAVKGLVPEPATPETIADAFLLTFGLPADATEERVVALKVVNDHGGVKVLTDAGAFADTLYHTLRILSASPKMQMC